MKVHLLTTATILGLSAVLLTLAISAPLAQTPVASAPGVALGPADTYFVTQTSLGTLFQVDSGRIAKTKGTTRAIRSYADLMVSSHITVNNALLASLSSWYDKATSRLRIWASALVSFVGSCSAAIRSSTAS